jgi:hypothetical protein
MAQDPSKPQGKSPPPAQNSPARTEPGVPDRSGDGRSAATIDVELLKQVLQALAAGGGVPITVSEAAPIVVDRLVQALAAQRPVTVAFPPCSDVMLALINTQATPKDDVTRFFEEYFRFVAHEIVPLQVGGSFDPVLDPGLIQCTSGQIFLTRDDASVPIPVPIGWPPPWCLPPTCVTLRGNRRLTGPVPPAQPTLDLKRLFLGDVLFLFFFERMGIFKILGVILDDFATRGIFPISNGSLDITSFRDDVAALVLEAMCRQTKSGLSSTVRDRDATYRRCLGWTSDVGRPLNLPSQVNKATSQLFHRFIQAGSSFNNAKRLATAIRGTTTPAAAASLATLTEISDTLTLLKQRFEWLHYGRNYYNTLSGLVWTIAGLALLRELRTTLGIPPAYDQPHEYVTAAYDLLVLKRTGTPSEVNRYEVHKNCAVFGRNLLLDIDVLNEKDTTPNGELELWLAQVEGEIEGYRKAYRDMTNVDLGELGTPVIEQEA